MKKLVCDFARPAAASPLGWALLAVGVAAALAAAAEFRRLDRENATATRQLRQLEHQAPGAAATRPAVPDAGRDAALDAALDSARRTRQHINLPWSQLFAALEAAGHDDVALLTLNPDGRRGEVRIFAEARTMTAMLAFQRRLETSGQLHDVTLTDHEVAAQDPLHPVRFNVVGKWVKSDANP